MGTTAGIGTLMSEAQNLQVKAAGTNYREAEAGAGACRIAPDYEAAIRRWESLICRAAGKYNIEGNLIASIIKKESGGDPMVISKDGAVGLMQIMPKDGIAANFRCKDGPCFADRPLTLQLIDAAYNIDYGTKMLKDLIDYFGGDIREALKWYGPKDAGYSYADGVLEEWKKHGN